MNQRELRGGEIFFAIKTWLSKLVQSIMLLGKEKNKKLIPKMHAYLPTKIWYLDTGESDSKEMTKNRPVAKNGLIEWYDWLANHIFETGKLVIFLKKKKSRATLIQKTNQ